jgi:effector-binding domain-containing protein
MFRKILYSIVISIIIFIIIGFLLPRHVHIERSIEIERPASTVFVLLNSYETFTSWSPWAERDPLTQYVFSGPDSGVGARMSWSGDPRLVGTGWQEITKSQPYSRVEMHLDFEQQGAADSYFQIDEMLSGVHLTWGFDTDLVEGQGLFGGLLARYFGLFFDKWIGTDYEQGLARLKVFAESLPASEFSDLDVEIVDVEPLDILYISRNTNLDSLGFTASLAAAYEEITLFMAENDIEMLSQPMAISSHWDEEGYQFDAAIPVIMRDVVLSGNVRLGRSPSGRAVRVVHHGSHDRMAPSYEKLAAYMAAHGLGEGRVSWEHYISDPSSTPESEITTHIYFLIDGGP